MTNSANSQPRAFIAVRICHRRTRAVAIYPYIPEMIHEQTLQQQQQKNMHNGENEYVQRTMFDGDDERDEARDYDTKDPDVVAIAIHGQREETETQSTLPQRSALHVFSAIVYCLHLLFFGSFVAILFIAIAREDVRLNNVSLR